MEQNDNSPQTAGKEITIEQATKYVDQYRDLKDQLKNSVLIKITDPERSNRYLKIEETEKHFHSRANAFLFSEETITRFFTEDKSDPNRAEFLMVFFGAGYDVNDPDYANPTVVVAGVKKSKEKGDTYVSLGLEYPATQHPPKIADYRFPDSDKDRNKSIEITLL